MDPKLKETIEKSTLLSEELKARLLKVGDKLTPEQIAKIVTAIDQAEVDKTAILAEQKQKTDQINRDFYEKVKKIAHDAPQKAMKTAENADQKAEETELNNVLAELDKL